MSRKHFIEVIKNFLINRNLDIDLLYRFECEKIRPQNAFETSL